MRLIYLMRVICGLSLFCLSNRVRLPTYCCCCKDSTSVSWWLSQRRYHDLHTIAPTFTRLLLTGSVTYIVFYAHVRLVPISPTPVGIHLYTSCNESSSISLSFYRCCFCVWNDRTIHHSSSRSTKCTRGGHSVGTQ